MNLVARFNSLRAVPKGYGGTGRGMGGSAYSDIQNKNRAPTALELIRELVGIAYACADINAQAVAANHCRLYVPKSKGRQTKGFRFAVADVPQPSLFRKGRKVFWNGHVVKTAAAAGLQLSDAGDVVEVTTHPVLDVLRKPERGPLALSAYAHTHITQMSLETLGVAYWRVDRDGAGIPVAFPFLPAQRVKPVIDYGTGQLTGYTFDRKPVPLEDIIRFSIPDMVEPHFRTASPTMACFEKVCIGRRMDARLLALMQNSARPDALFVPKGDSEGGGIGEYEARRVRSAMRQAFSEAGTGGVMVSEFPGALQILGWKPGDVVEIERAKMVKIDIMNSYGVPNAMMDLNEANLASAKTAEFQYAVRTIAPRCTRYQDTLTMHVIPMFDQPKSGSSPLFFAYDSTVPDDEVFELETAKVAGQIGLAKVDEGRASAGLAPLGGRAGEMRYINGVPLDDDGMPIQQAAAPPVPGAQSGNEPTGKKWRRKFNPNHDPHTGEFAESGGPAGEGRAWLHSGGRQITVDSAGRINDGPAMMLGHKPGEPMLSEEMRIGDKAHIPWMNGSPEGGPIVKMTAKAVWVRGRDLNGKQHDFRFKRTDISHVVRGDTVHPVEHARHGKSVAKAHKPSDVDDTLFSDPELLKAVAAINQEVTIDRDYDVPYLGGTGAEPTTVYLDRHMPTEYDRFIVVHEVVERALMDTFGIAYPLAHQIATRAEQEAVEAADIAWDDYNRKTLSWVNDAYSEDLTSVPPDLDMRPYEAEGDQRLIERMREAMPTNGKAKGC